MDSSSHSETIPISVTSGAHKDPTAASEGHSRAQPEKEGGTPTQNPLATLATQPDNKGNFEPLPDEDVLYILSFLDLSDLIVVDLVGQFFKRLARDLQMRLHQRVVFNLRERYGERHEERNRAHYRPRFYLAPYLLTQPAITVEVVLKFFQDLFNQPDLDKAMLKQWGGQARRAYRCALSETHQGDDDYDVREMSLQGVQKHTKALQEALVTITPYATVFSQAFGIHPPPAADTKQKQVDEVGKKAIYDFCRAVDKFERLIIDMQFWKNAPQTRDRAFFFTKNVIRKITTPQVIAQRGETWHHLVRLRWESILLCFRVAQSDNFEFDEDEVKVNEHRYGLANDDYLGRMNQQAFEEAFRTPTMPIFYTLVALNPRIAYRTRDDFLLDLVNTMPMWSGEILYSDTLVIGLHDDTLDVLVRKACPEEIATLTENDAALAQRIQKNPKIGTGYTEESNESENSHRQRPFSQQRLVAPFRRPPAEPWYSPSDVYEASHRDIGGSWVSFTHQKLSLVWTFNRLKESYLKTEVDNALRAGAQLNPNDIPTDSEDDTSSETDERHLTFNTVLGMLEEVEEVKELSDTQQTERLPNTLQPQRRTLLALPPGNKNFCPTGLNISHLPRTVHHKHHPNNPTSNIGMFIVFLLGVALLAVASFVALPQWTAMLFIVLSAYCIGLSLVYTAEKAICFMSTKLSNWTNKASAISSSHSPSPNTDINADASAYQPPSTTFIPCDTHQNGHQQPKDIAPRSLLQ